MDVSLFDFDLPPERIALRPVFPRDTARMLRITAGSPDFMDDHVFSLPLLLRAGDALVVNDTRVIPARLNGTRQRGEAVAAIEATLHKREGQNQWRAFVRPAKKLKIGETVIFTSQGQSAQALPALVREKHDGEVLFEFAFSGAELDQAFEAIGTMPLPPYIAAKRSTDAADSQDYQTLFAQNSGAVAAPTASLHFTPTLVQALHDKGASLHKVTLHVGAGTFLPVKADRTQDHVMHSEWGMVSEETAKALRDIRQRGGRIIAVGTTTLRILETAALHGTIQPFAGETQIFLTPGSHFQAVDGLLTNFHLPRSTLFMLVSAFCGLETMQKAYAHAIDQNYRFYSYGDACLLFRASQNHVAP